MTNTLKNIGKKELKEYINKNGGFLPSTVENVETNFPAAAKKKIEEKFAGDQAKIDLILESSVYVKAISSNGDLNRNGYIIRANAWKKAIDGYLENGIVLLQHEPNEIIGETFAAKVTKNGLETEMFIFKDQMTEADQKRFERGQLKGISTGHITLAVEWENEETGEILDTEEFSKLDWDERIFGAWVMAVTELEWVEQSLVTIPSNRASKILKKNRKLDYCVNTLGLDVPAEILTKINEVETEEPEQVAKTGDELMEEVKEAAIKSADENDTDTAEATEVVDDPSAETAENVVTGANPDSDTEAENVEGEEPAGAEAVETTENVGPTVSNPVISEIRKNFYNGMSARFKNHVAEVEKVETNELSTDPLVINTNSLEEMFGDLEANGLGNVVEKFKTELSALELAKNEAETECTKYKEIVKNTPLRKKLVVTSQSGVTDAPQLSEVDVEKKENLGTALEKKGVVINYKARNSGKITTFTGKH